PDAHQTLVVLQTGGVAAVLQAQQTRSAAQAPRGSGAGSRNDVDCGDGAMSRNEPPARRVAVTGLGIVCGLGSNQREFWARATEGENGIRKLDLFDTSG